MTPKAVLLVALLIAAAGANAQLPLDSDPLAPNVLSEQYEVVLAGTLDNVLNDRGEWQAIAVEMSKFMDRGEWA